jgi:GT2 family glycosyltransferase/lipopolysaccharide/colanic/teichoic acid biosynthesis glycosyltransferase
MARNKSRHRPSLHLSIIIVNYNVRDFLQQSLRSLEKARKGLKSEIIVVDNASGDGSVEMLRAHFPKVRLVVNSSNEGFAKANNIGLKMARGEYCLLINPDTVVQEDTLRVMLGLLRNHPEVGLAGCKILSPDGSFQLACRRSFPTPWVAFTKLFGLASLAPQSKVFGQYNLTYRDVNESYEVDAVSGSFMMIRREVYDRVGGLDEEFFMYGEDLDWCYRIQEAGWKIYYVHATSIIHYKGESTKRSSLNEIQTFYAAMHLFVKKHYGRSHLLAGMLRVGIAVTAKIALIRSLLNPMRYSVIDLLIVPLSMICAEYIWRGGVFLYPSYAYPIVFVVPAIIVVGTLYGTGVYTTRAMSISRSITSVLMSYIVISTLIAFFRTYAFSRMIVIISGVLCLFLIPGWRVVLRAFGKVRVGGRRSVMGKRTLIVGTDPSARTLLKKLRSYVAGDYDIVGFVDATLERVGETIDEVPVVGSYETIAKVAQSYRVHDLIFSPRSISYGEILSMISRTREQSINFHLVPSTMEVIIGKGSIDSLNEVPLIQISYNIEQPLHRLTKRLFDLGISGLLLITVYPILEAIRRPGNSPRTSLLRELPAVFKGSMSLVGPLRSEGGSSEGDLYIGKPGLTGMVQLQGLRKLAPEEIDQLNLYYARNQSVMLDVEILLKTWLNRRRQRKSE